MQNYLRILILSLLSCLVLTPPAPAVSFFPASGEDAPTDLAAQPLNYCSWDQSVITWKMTPEFLQKFPTALQQEQVRLAFEEWETASASVLRRSTPRYSWQRFKGAQPVCDLRSVITHEIGHVLGSQHPDASWLNRSRQRNFRPDGSGGWTAAPPIGTEIMNEGTTGTLGEKGLRGGEYWRLVSRDELDLLDHAYGRQIQFQEVLDDGPAEIVVQLHNVGGGPAANLGSAGPSGSTLRVPADPTQGAIITAGVISINANPTCSLGVQARPSSWRFTNRTGSGVVRLGLQTCCTDNRSAIDFGSTGEHRFASFGSTPTIPALQFEDVVWAWEDPAGGHLPDGASVGISLQLDTWDWWVRKAFVNTDDGQVLPISSLAITDFKISEPAPRPAVLPMDFRTHPAIPGLGSPVAPEIIGGGFGFIASDLPVTISYFAYAPVDGFGLGRGDLTPATLETLRQLGLLRELDLGDNPIELGPGDDFFVVLEGQEVRLPPELLTQGNFLGHPDPGLLSTELLVYSRSEGEGGVLETFSLLNTPKVGLRSSAR